VCLPGQLKTKGLPEVLPTPTAGDAALARRVATASGELYETGTGSIRVRGEGPGSSNLGLPGVLMTAELPAMLPTPTASTGGPERTFRPGRGQKLASVLANTMLPTPLAGDHKGTNMSGRRTTSAHNLPTTLKRAHLETLPTPRASDADKGGRGDLLTVLRGYESKHAGTLPTPMARDSRSGKASPETHGKNSRPLNEVLSNMSGNQSGRMNPRFREWMMGFPIGWTEP